MSSYFYSATMGFMMLAAIITIGVKYKQSHPNQNVVSTKSQQCASPVANASKAEAPAARAAMQGMSKSEPDPLKQLTQPMRMRNAPDAAHAPASRVASMPGSQPRMRQLDTNSMQHNNRTVMRAYRQPQSMRQSGAKSY